MEGNYYFQWQEVEASGNIVSKNERTIYGVTLQEAIATFVTQHGELGPDEAGVCIIVTALQWQPL